MNYLEHLKHSFFAKGCAPTFSVHLYTINVIRRLFWHFLKNDKKVFLFIFADLIDAMPNKYKKFKQRVRIWQKKYLRYLIKKDWKKINDLYFINTYEWELYLEHHPDRKTYFDKIKKMRDRLLDIELEKERIDYDYLSKYMEKYVQ